MCVYVIFMYAEFRKILFAYLQIFTDLMKELYFSVLSHRLEQMACESLDGFKFVLS